VKTLKIFLINVELLFNRLDMLSQLRTKRAKSNRLRGLFHRIDRSRSSSNPFGRDRHSPTCAKSAIGNLQSRWCLATFEFCNCHEFNHAIDWLGFPSSPREITVSPTYEFSVNIDINRLPTDFSDRLLVQSIPSVYEIESDEPISVHTLNNCPISI
jgi:hypothetical protein